MEYLNILLTASAQGGKQSPLMSILFFILIIVVFYLFLIKPQVKRQKEIQKFRQSLKKGDKVITAGGIYGKVTDIKENIVILEIAPDIRIKVDINTILKDSSDLAQQK
jgi:preprotein translocase subunit YajC